MSKVELKTKYYYCPDYKKFVKCERGMFYYINNGKEVFGKNFDRILIGDIFTRDISKEDYYAQLY